MILRKLEMAPVSAFQHRRFQLQSAPSYHSVLNAIYVSNDVLPRDISRAHRQPVFAAFFPIQSFAFCALSSSPA